MGNRQSPSLLTTVSPATDIVHRESSIQLSRREVEDVLKALENTRHVLEILIQQAQHTGSGGGGGGGRKRGWWADHCWPTKRRSIARYILIITAVLQAVNLTVVSVIDVWPKRDDQSVMIGTGVTMILLQVVNLVFIVMVSARLVKRLKKHKVSMLLLAQSYVSTLLLFAGLYTLTYRLQPKSWKFIQEQLEQDPILVIVLYCKFLFFSVSTATLCGSDNALPQEWYNCVFTATQMLMSFVYFASILGQTLSQDTQHWLGVGNINEHNDNHHHHHHPHPVSTNHHTTFRPSSSDTHWGPRNTFCNVTDAMLTGPQESDWLLDREGRGKQYVINVGYHDS